MNTLSSPHIRLRRPEQRGVVLIIAMILLVVVSLLAVSSVRNSASTESVLGNVRTSELAAQAADIALRHCEASVVEVISVAGGASPSYPTTFVLANIQAASTTPQWQSTGIWDSSANSVYVLPLALVNQAGGTIGATYRRPPECLVESLPVILTGTSAVNISTSFVVTARGFGPEVPALAASAARVRPLGSEVWLQSQIGL